MARIPRKDILDKFQAMIARREPIIGGEEPRLCRGLNGEP